MPYDPDTRKNDWVKLAGNLSRNIFNSVNDAHWRGFQEWNSFVDGRTDADVAAALLTDVSTVQDLAAAYDKLDAIKTVLDANAGPLRKFT